MQVNERNMSDFEVVELAWNYKIEQNLPWDFCAAALSMDLGAAIDIALMERAFANFFHQNGDVEVFEKCPVCGRGTMIPQRIEGMYYVSCTEYPECEHSVTIDSESKTTYSK